MALLLSGENERNEIPVTYLAAAKVKDGLIMVSDDRGSSEAHRLYTDGAQKIFVINNCLVGIQGKGDLGIEILNQAITTDKIKNKDIVEKVSQVIQTEAAKYYKENKLNEFRPSPAPLLSYIVAGYSSESQGEIYHLSNETNFGTHRLQKPALNLVNPNTDASVDGTILSLGVWNTFLKHIRWAELDAETASMILVFFAKQVGQSDMGVGIDAYYGIVQKDEEPKLLYTKDTPKTTNLISDLEKWFRRDFLNSILIDEIKKRRT
jgi:hypothetical protein